MAVLRTNTVIDGGHVPVEPPSCAANPVETPCSALLQPQTAANPPAKTKLAANTYNGNGSSQVGRAGSSSGSGWNQNGAGGGATRRLNGNVHGLNRAADAACMPSGGG